MADRQPRLFLRLLGAEGASAAEAESKAWLLTGLMRLILPAVAGILWLVLKFTGRI